MNFSFTYSHYLNFIDACKQIEAFHLFRNALSAKKGFLLRHDIDFDLELALKLLEVEADVNVVSTNFILVSNPAYNIHTKKSRKAISWMITNKFEVGLHFDPTVYDYKSFDEIEKNYLLEKDLLEQVCNQEVKSVSLHCPSIHGEFLEFKNVVNAYDKRIFQDANYLSDSRMTFRNKEPYELIKGGDERLLQLLFHPIHFRETESSYKEIFKDLAIKRVNELDSLIRPYNTKFVEDLENKKLLDVL